MIGTMRESTFGRNIQDFTRVGRIPVFQDCISFLTKPRENKKAAFCLEGLFKSSGSDRKVHLLRQAYQLGRNPLRMLGLQDPYAVAGILQVWLRELPEPVIREDLFDQVLQSQQHQDEMHRLHSLQAALKQNDAYRLRILMPLLELLHHYCINQRSIQHAAEYVAEKFATCLLRPEHRTTLHPEEAALAVSASTVMVLEYRTLLGQSIVEFDARKAQQRPRSRSDMSQQMGKLHSARSCPMPASPMAAKRLPSSGLHLQFQSEPEEFEHSIQAAKACTSPSFLDSPMSDDIDSAFSGSSVELDDSTAHPVLDDVDADLVHAVNSLFLESTSDVLFTGNAIKPAFGLATSALDDSL